MLRFIEKKHLGIEIAPWINSLASKAKGYNCLTLDVFDKERLISNALSDPNIPNELVNLIENVDFVGSACDIETIVSNKHRLGSFDYIISSHNFEHLPNPILFLQGCSKVLKSGGVLSMALPDKRVCFDYFRPHSITTDWLEAYFEKRTRPTAKQLFTQTALHSRYCREGNESLSFELSDDPENIVPFETLREAFQNWENFQKWPDETYRDAHCWTFTPSYWSCCYRIANI